VASYAQERVWLAGQIAREGPLHHISEEFPLHAQIPEQRILEAFAVVAMRHETLRTGFVVSGGTLMQVIVPDVDPPAVVLDLRGEEPPAQEREIERTAARLAFEPFDLERAPLWRAVVLRLADEAWHVLFVAHQAVFDAESGLNLYAELTELCAAEEQHRSPRLPDLPVPFSLHASRQRARLAGPQGRTLLEHWARRLRALPAVHGLALDRPRGARRTFAGAETRAVLPRSALQTLPALAARLHTTEFEVLLAAYVALLHRRSGRCDIVVGVPAAGRDRAELRPLIGTFVNMLVLRVDTSGDPSFGQLVDRVSERTREAHEHQELPFQTAVEHFCGPRSAGVAPLYQLAFNVLASRGFGPPSSAVEDELLLEIAGSAVRLEYNSALFDAATVQCLLADYRALLAAGVLDPATALSALPTTAAEPAPESERRVEELVAQVWSEVLHQPGIGHHDDFFSLGGHSLQALRILSALAERCGVQPALHEFFAEPTVAGLAATIECLLARRNP
jgi:hypothetical protein